MIQTKERPGACAAQPSPYKDSHIGYSLFSPTGSEAQFSTRRPYRERTFSQNDHQVLWRAGDLWHGLSMRPTYEGDTDWFTTHPDRRMRLRTTTRHEALQFANEGWWLVIVRSAHDHNWNTIGLPFLARASWHQAPWQEPSHDDAVLGIVGQHSARVMIDAALLAVAPPLVSHCFAGFNRGAHSTDQ